MQPEGSSDAYSGSSVNGFSRTPTNSLGTGAPPPWRSHEFVPVNKLSISSKPAVFSSFYLMKPYYFPYGHVGQGGITHTGFPVFTEPVSNNAMNFSYPFPGTSSWQSNQGATPVWQLADLNWVNYEAQGELHLTIVFRKAPFT